MDDLVMIKKTFWKNKRVLITGHTGFKGSWLSLWLNKLGAEVFGISLEPDSKPCLFSQASVGSLISESHLIDICNLEELRDVIFRIKPEIVFHLAAQPLVIKSYHDPIETWRTNVIGSLNLLESLRDLRNVCSIVMVTTDKVYENREWDFGYRENDKLGGKDPYSASKAACEIAISSWRSSFCGSKPNQNPFLAIATARSGNVIGGGDWAQNRIVPDVIRSIQEKKIIKIRNPYSTRPWQHVLEPLSGYLLLAEKLTYAQIDKKNNSINRFTDSFNFGPEIESNKSVLSLIKTIFKEWPGEWADISDPMSIHEANRLHLNIDKVFYNLYWEPRWSFSISVSRTINWYKNVYYKSTDALSACLNDIEEYEKYLD